MPPVWQEDFLTAVRERGILSVVCQASRCGLSSHVPGCSSKNRGHIGSESFVLERRDWFIIPAQFRVIVTRRPKYACRACTDGVAQAPAPARLIQAGLPTEATIAHVLVSKYADHLPLLRSGRFCQFTIHEQGHASVRGRRCRHKMRTKEVDGTISTPCSKPRRQMRAQSTFVPARDTVTDMPSV
jgi:hypothetical protein